MARTTKQLSGAGKDKFLRGLIASEPGIPSDAVTSLGDRMSDAIADIRVRREAWEGGRKSGKSQNLPSEEGVQSGKNAEFGDRPVLPAAASQPASATSVAAAFDPFAFSALAVLTKKGRAALADAFAKIDSTQSLHALATAQHLSVDADLTDLAALREAMIKATEARLAERRAAAS